MSGDQESLAKDTLTKIEDELDNYLKNKGYVRIIKPAVEEYLEMSRSELRSLPTEELGEAAYDLSRYAYYLQGILNDIEAKIYICESQIRRLVGTKLDNYNVFGIENKWIAAIADNDVARRFQVLKDKAAVLKIKLNYIPKRLEDLSKVVLEIQQTRRRNGKI